MKGGHFFYNYFKDMEEYLINFQKYTMWGINSSYVFKKKKQVGDQKDFPTNYIYSLLIAVPAQHSLNSEEKFKTVSREFMSTHVHKYTLRNVME